MSRNDLVVQVEKIDQRMRELERERIDVLCQDLEYAAYLNRCDLCGRLERLALKTMAGSIQIRDSIPAWATF